MSEWAKQQACWNGLKGRMLQYSDDFDTCLILADAARTAKRDEKTKNIMTEGINAQSEVVTLGTEFWKKVLAFGRKNTGFTPKDMQIIEICASIPRRLPTDLQSRHALETLERMKNQGFVFQK